MTLRSRVRLDCPDCAKSGLHGTIVDLPVPGVADLIWDELWEGDTVEVKTASSIQPSYTLDEPRDRLPVSRLVELPIQTMTITDFVERHGDTTEGFAEHVAYCGRPMMKYQITGEGSPLGNPFTIKDCEKHLKAKGKSTQGEAPLKLACSLFKDVLRQTLNIQLNRAMTWRGLDAKFPVSTKTGNLLTIDQVKSLIEADYPGATVATETAIARMDEYSGRLQRVMDDAASGWLSVPMLRLSYEGEVEEVVKRVNHQAIWDELNRLAQVYREQRRIVLLCWCPGHCHTYAIARAVEYLAGKEA